ncbi:hypothetical protein ES703_58629 [subsurface metagenome]
MVSILYMTKVAVARVLTFAMVCDLLFWMQKKVLGNNYIRAINYHDTPANTADNFEKQLCFYQQHFSPVSLSDLDSFFNSCKWKKDKPGLIISFDDGYKSNYGVAAPLLQKYGFTGWFFVSVDFIYTPGIEQAKSYNNSPTMSWDELGELDKKHVIGCHTRSHHRMTAETTERELDKEIAQAKYDLEAKLQDEIDIFCWCGGDRQSYSSAAARYIAKTGYRYSFMTNSAPILANTERLHLQRTNIESNWPVELVKFQLSGIMDILYTPKRAWVNKITIA